MKRLMVFGFVLILVLVFWGCNDPVSHPVSQPIDNCEVQVGLSWPYIDSTCIDSIRVYYRNGMNCEAFIYQNDIQILSISYFVQNWGFVDVEPFKDVTAIILSTDSLLEIDTTILIRQFSESSTLGHWELNP